MKQLNSLSSFLTQTSFNSFLPWLPWNLRTMEKSVHEKQIETPFRFFPYLIRDTRPLIPLFVPLLTLYTKVLFSHHSLPLYAILILHLYSHQFLSSFNCFPLRIRNYLIQSLITLKSRSHLTNIFMTSLFKILIL